MSALPTAVVSAWQAALAAEHEAVFAYGLVGPRLPADEQSTARSAQQAHVTLRDATSATLTGAGVTPVAPPADYPALPDVASAAAAVALALRVEDACAVAWRYLYLRAASTDGSADVARVRASAQTGLTASAVRAARWAALGTATGAIAAFPGL